MKTLRGQKIERLDRKQRTGLGFRGRAHPDRENDVCSKRGRAGSAQDKPTQFNCKIKVPGRSGRTHGRPGVPALHASDESQGQILGRQRADVVCVWQQVQDQRFRRWSIKGNYRQA